MQGKIHRFFGLDAIFLKQNPFRRGAKPQKNPRASPLDPANAVVSPDDDVWRRPSNLNAKHAE